MAHGEGEEEYLVSLSFFYAAAWDEGSEVYTVPSMQVLQVPFFLLHLLFLGPDASFSEQRGHRFIPQQGV